VFAREAFDQRVERAFHHVRQVVQGQAVDAVVGDPALRIVVRADALAAIAAADLQLAGGGGSGGAALGLGLGEHRAQALHRLVAVCVLAALGLRFDHDAAGHVGNADRRVGLVDVLAAGAGGAEGVDLQVGGIDLDRRAVLFDRDDRHRRRGGVDAALRFGLRHALHAVGAGFELQVRVRAAALDAGDHLAEAAVLAGTGRFDFHPPALALGVAGVHAQQVAGEDRGLVATGACADFEVQVALVARIARDQQRHQRVVECLEARVGGDDFLVGQFAQLRVGLHRLRGGKVVARLALVRKRGGDRFELGEFA